MEFEWDTHKESINWMKHGVSFLEAQHAFADPKRVITRDLTHSRGNEERYFCFGKIGERVVTVRFIYREDRIRIFGAGAWREGKQMYEKKNNL